LGVTDVVVPSVGYLFDGIAFPHNGGSAVEEDGSVVPDVDVATAQQFDVLRGRIVIGVEESTYLISG
jgi:hypothetical protein